MNDFLAFRKMITPMIIQAFFWLLVIVCVISGIIYLSKNAFIGLVLIVVGPFFIRIYCEMLIVLFVMNDALQDIRKNTAPKSE